MSYTTRTVPALLAAVLLLAVSLAAQTTDSAQVLLRTAMDTALVDGDLEGAITQYQTIVETFETDRGVVAIALVQMAELYEKLGEPEARTVYERVLRDYADQAGPVAAVRVRLTALEVEPRPPSSTMTVRELMRSAEQQPGHVQAMPSPPFTISSDGQMFVYTDWNTGDLATRNMATGEVRGLYGVSWQNDSIEFFEDPVLSPDDKKVAHVRYANFAGGATRIEVDSIEGGHRETVYDANDQVNLFNLDWSPDGEHILISGEAADRSAFLATLSLEDKTLQRLVTLNWERPRRAEYSPDGRFIAYDSSKGGDRKIYLISADGAQERVLVDSPGQDDSPLWTRDGRFLLFRSDRSGKWDLYALRMQNGQPTGDDILLKSNLGAATTLGGVTTAGQLFYFETVGGSDIAITERITTPAQTAHVRTLPKVGVTNNSRPAFAPDAKRVVCLARTPQVTRRIVRITDLEGTILKDIPLERRFNTNDPPEWSPDGKKLGLRVYGSGENQLMVLSAETGAVLKVVSPLEEKGFFFPLGWSRDSRLFYVLLKPNVGDTSLATIDVETEQVVESTVLSHDVRRARLSPSGNYLAMALTARPAPGQEPVTQLVLRSLEDGSERLLTEGRINRFFTRDFDSRHLLYRKSEDDRQHSFSLDTEEETVLVEDMQDFGLAAVSPDGQYWALQNRGRENARILVLENFLPGSNEQTASR